MIIEIEKKASVIDKKADALLLVVDRNGRDMNGMLKHWLDIAQVIEMMATCKQINEQLFLDFETDLAHIFVICQDGIAETLPVVLNECTQRDVSSINVPSSPDIETTLWGAETQADILVRVCGK